MASTANIALPALMQPLPAAQRRRLGGCVLAVMLAHAAVLVATQTPGDVSPSPARSGAVQVRLLPSEAAAPTPATERAAAVAQPAAVLERADSSPPASRVDAVPASPEAGEPSADAELVYLPRAALTVGPKARSPVTVSYPAFDGEADTYTGEFELFIDDHGGVVRVVSANPELPGILVGAVREAFLSAAFSPGERQGRPVRSRIRIEVTFDRRDLRPS